VPVGRTVRFQVRDAATARDDLEATLADLRGSVAEIDGALLVSCTGRGGRLFETAGHDVDAVRSALAAPSVAGFFATGEVGPVGGRNHLHGFSAALMTFGNAH
jgi:small ligand-binding sensory domain FIST